MSIAAIIALVFSIVGALVGALITHPISKAEGKKEGAKEANADQQITQAHATVKAVQERAHVEIEVAADTDSALNDRLSKHDRPG